MPNPRIFPRTLPIGLLLAGSSLALALPLAATPASLAAERHISLCSNENMVHARPRLCNESEEVATFTVNYAPLPAGVYSSGICTLAGPTNFVLAEAQPVLLPSRSCVDLHLEVARPAGMGPTQSACYSITARNLATDEAFTGQTSFYDSGNICAFPQGASSTRIKENHQVPMAFSLTNTTGEGRMFNYQFESTSSDGTSDVLLNGGPSGGIVTGQTSVPAGGTAAFSVDVALAVYDPATRHDVILRDRDSGAALSSRGFRSFTFACNQDDSTLCLGDGRFEVKSMWRDFIGQTGAGHAIGLTVDTGYFWFFSPDNVEVMLKVLDGRYINDQWWVFFGALSSVEYTITVRDTVTGESKSYNNPSGVLASVGDIAALPGYQPTSQPMPSEFAILGGPATHFARPYVAPPATVGSCIPSDQVFCVQNGRFSVEATWTVIPTGSGNGHANSLTAETGYFWFFSPNNIELVLKVLDGRSINGHWWVFFGALSDVDYTLKVTDTVTGDVKVFHNPQGRLASIADIEAFVD